MDADYGMARDEQQATAETRIWQAVILQTIEEWMHGPLRVSLQAERYLFSDNRDFPVVCQSAGMDIGRLRAGLGRVRCRVARPERLSAAA
jgi:hypothetical protein